MIYQLEKRRNELYRGLTSLYEQKELITIEIDKFKSSIAECELNIKIYNEKCKAIQTNPDEIFEIIKHAEPAKVEAKSEVKHE